METQYLKVKDKSMITDTIYKHAKNQRNSFIHSWDTEDYGDPWPKRTYPYLSFDHAHSVTFIATFSFLKYVLTCKKSSRFIHSLKLESNAHSHSKIIKVFLNFPEFASACKISAQLVYSFIHSPSCDQGGHNNFWPHLLQYFSISSWYQHVKKQTISSLCFNDIFDLKSCNLIDQHCFGPRWLRNKLPDLYNDFTFAKKMIEN